MTLANVLNSLIKLLQSKACIYRDSLTPCGVESKNNVTSHVFVGTCSTACEDQLNYQVCLIHNLANLASIRESVDSLCRDGANVQYMQYLRKSRIISPQIR